MYPAEKYCKSLNSGAWAAWGGNSAGREKFAGLTAYSRDSWSEVNLNAVKRSTSQWVRTAQRPQEPPYRVPAHRDPCRGQQILQPVDRQMRRLADQRSNQLPVRLQKPASVAADLARRHGPPRPPAGNPFGDRGNADTVTRRHRPDRLARQVGSDNGFAKVIRVSSAHPCWPASPVTSLNHIP